MAANFNKEWFRSSLLEEVISLQEVDCFEIEESTEVKGHCLYRSIFVDQVKQNVFQRSCLCATACDDQHYGLFTVALIIRRISLPFLLSMAAALKFSNVHSGRT